MTPIDSLLCKITRYRTSWRVHRLITFAAWMSKERLPISRTSFANCCIPARLSSSCSHGVHWCENCIAASLDSGTGRRHAHDTSTKCIDWRKPMKKKLWWLAELNPRMYFHVFSKEHDARNETGSNLRYVGKLQANASWAPLMVSLAFSKAYGKKM